ncbi:hypothetical protein EVAR_57125_1 [Eumeta japonica]|uniref:Uncharacterized protein n=1 Tax=Eumeta variegata TaxID=151549 RepID=A0A4C1YUF3_EUMVA|nr:hypothetical protein EVAR_57125_1 [Eumeta japonica]
MTAGRPPRRPRPRPPEGPRIAFARLVLDIKKARQRRSVDWIRAMRAFQKRTRQPKVTLRIVCEASKTLLDLPTFNGNVSEWNAFRAVCNNTSELFNDVQNAAWIRKAFSGEARETCQALIYTETDTLRTMQALVRRFGRPDAIIKQELYKLRRMALINDGMSDISSFANKDADEPELVMLSNFLNKIASQCRAPMPIEKSRGRNSRPALERRPCRKNEIDVVKYDNKNMNSAHTAIQPLKSVNVE